MIKIVLLLVIIAELFAHENLPTSSNAQEGKSVYIPTPVPVNLYEEQNLQKEDQNSTGHGAAKP